MPTYKIKIGIDTIDRYLPVLSSTLYAATGIFLADSSDSIIIFQSKQRKVALVFGWEK